MPTDQFVGWACESGPSQPAGPSRPYVHVTPVVDTAFPLLMKSMSSTDDEQIDKIKSGVGMDISPEDNAYKGSIEVLPSKRGLDIFDTSYILRYFHQYGSHG